MRSRKEIIRAHYAGLAKKIARWSALVALVGSVFMPLAANAAVGQLTPRKATLSTSVGNAAGVTATFAFNPSSANSGATIKGIKFQLCDSPLEAVTCSSPAGATMGSATAGGQTPYVNQYGTPAYTTTTAVTFKHGTGNVLSSSDAITFPVAGIHNPTAPNTSFYFRITTYNDDTTFNGTTEVDFGAMAVSTTNQVTVSANVQEQLAFCVYTNANCGLAGNSVNIGMNPAQENVLTTSQMYGGVSKMDASTNAATGYAIQYITTSNGGASGTQCVGGFSSTTDCIAEAGGSAVDPPAAGTGMFGINLKANTTTLTPAGAIGADASGGVGGAVAPYGTADKVAFQGGATPRTVANTGNAPSLNTTYTVTYAAQAATTTKPGQYSATFTYIATGTF